MLRVTVELVPHGIEERKETLATVEIANDRSGTLESGNYNVTARVADSDRVRTGRVTEFPRLELGPISLVRRALSSLTSLPTLTEELLAETVRRTASTN